MRLAFSRLTRIGLGLGALLTAAAVAPAAAAPAFPTKQVRIVIPFTPGQGSDILARALSSHLSTRWGHPVVVENRAGANGAIALQEVARSGADGHTLLLTSNSPIVINPNLYQKLPYDVERNFAAVALLAATDMVMVVNKDFPAQDIPGVVKALKAAPGKYNFGSPGKGSTSHLSMEVFKRLAGVELTHVPYKGSPPAYTDMIGGAIEMMIDAMPSALPQVRNGRVRAIAITSHDQPSSIAPEIPTAESQGMKGLPSRAWYGVFAPAGTDPAIVDKIQADLSYAMKQPDIVQRMPQLGLESSPDMSAAQFADFVRKDTEYWKQATQRIGLYHQE